MVFGQGQNIYYKKANACLIRKQKKNRAKLILIDLYIYHLPVRSKISTTMTSISVKTPDYCS